MYVLLRMPFKVHPLPCFIIFLPECTRTFPIRGTAGLLIFSVLQTIQDLVK